MHGKLPSKKFHALLHEGCPLEAVGECLPAFAAYTGLVPAFCQAGFIVVARYSKGRPIYRYWIGG